MTEAETEYGKLKSQTAHFLGFGRGEDFGDSAWDERTERTIVQCVNGGLVDVYMCGHDWTWMRPMVELSLLDGKNTVALPIDFGGKDGEVTLALADGQICGRIPWGPLASVYDREAAYPDSTGRPVVLCEETVNGTSDKFGQRRQIHVWPTADQDYLFRFQMYIVPAALSTPFPFAYGGPELAEVRLQACKAYAERVIDGMAGGPMEMRFKELLTAAISADNRHAAKRIGYNADRSMFRGIRSPYGIHHLGRTSLTVNGVTYD